MAASEELVVSSSMSIASLGSMSMPSSSTSKSSTSSLSIARSFVGEQKKSTQREGGS